MKNHCIKLLLAITAQFITLYAHAQVQPLQNCEQLKMPKSAVIIYKESCSHCKRFMPIYEKVSADPQFTDWHFYKKELVSWYSPICQHYTYAVPTIYLHNFDMRHMGEMDEKALTQFLLSNAD